MSAIVLVRLVSLNGHDGGSRT